MYIDICVDMKYEHLDFQQSLQLCAYIKLVYVCAHIRLMLFWHVFDDQVVIQQLKQFKQQQLVIV